MMRSRDLIQIPAYIMGEYCRKFSFEDSKYSVIIEDDDRVCYGYLLDADGIIADVWLYNTKETPEDMPWSDAFPMPFLNQKSYVDQERMLKIEDEDDVRVQWFFDGVELKHTDIYIREELVARLKPGATPGWSTRVVKDGPLASVLKREINRAKLQQ